VTLSQGIDAERRYVSLFWRLFIPNACVRCALGIPADRPAA